jgi:hypothetical protein
MRSIGRSVNYPVQLSFSRHNCFEVLFKTSGLFFTELNIYSCPRFKLFMKISREFACLYIAYRKAQSKHRIKRFLMI